MTIQGGCLCGAVRYDVSGPLGATGHCHCSMCRRAHGAAFGTYTLVDPKDFRWISGEDLVSVYQSDARGGRGFCTRCGSTLAAVEHGKVTSITPGTLDGDPEIVPQLHAHVSSKASWFEITDDLPQFEKIPSGSGW